MLAAVRSATMGAGLGSAAAAPFRNGPWLFSHNGALNGWPDAAVPLLRLLPDAGALSLEAPTDTALLWALTRTRLQDGAALGDALTDVVKHVMSAGGGRLNLLLTDGRTIAATTQGDSLVWRCGGDAVIVASEPHDDGDWQDVPDGALLLATPHQVQCHPL